MKRIIIALFVLFAGCSSQNYENQKPFFSLLWKYEGIADVLGQAVKGYGENIICASVSGSELLVLNSIDGTPNWHLEIDTKPGPDVNFAPFVTGNTIISFSGDSLYAYDLTTGYELWKFQTEETTLGPPSFYQPDSFGKQVFVGTASGYLYCIDSGSGSGNWSVKNRYEGFGQVTCWKDKVIVRTLSGKIEARNRITGKLIWKNELWHLPDDKLTTDSNMLFLAEFGPVVAALDPSRGTYVWQKKNINHITMPLKFSPIISDNLMVVVQENEIYFFDKITGADLDRFNLEFTPESITITNKSILLTKGPKLYAFQMDKQKISEFTEPNGDTLLGVTICTNAIITWSPRTIYGLSK